MYWLLVHVAQGVTRSMSKFVSSRRLSSTREPIADQQGSVSRCLFDRLPTFGLRRGLRSIVAGTTEKRDAGESLRLVGPLPARTLHFVLTHRAPRVRSERSWIVSAEEADRATVSQALHDVLTDERCRLRPVFRALDRSRSIVHDLADDPGLDPRAPHQPVSRHDGGWPRILHTHLPLRSSPASRARQRRSAPRRLVRAKTSDPTTPPTHSHWDR